MANQNGGKESQLKDLRRKMRNVDGEERLQSFMELTRLKNDPENPDWTTGILQSLDIHSWSMEDPKHPKVVFSYTVAKHNSNGIGNMHGGCTASLFDFATSIPLCLINKPGFWNYMGVSRTLNVSYLRPIPIGEKILVECEIMSVGKTLCTIRGVMRRQSDGAVLATCEHGKFNTDPDAQVKSRI